MPRNQIIEEDLQTILGDTNIPWRAFEGATILITGANGFLPAYMVETLLYANDTLFRRKAKIIALVRSQEKALARFADAGQRDDIAFIEQDVADPVHIPDPVDYVIHAASHASPRFFFSDPVGTLDANALGTSHLLRLAKIKNVKGFLFFSSGEVCGDIFDIKSLVAEDDYGVLNPLVIRSCYGEGKRIGEAYCAAYAHQYGVPTRIVRPAHTYGPGFALDDGRAFASFVAAVMENRNIVLKSDGKACRSFVYLADAVRGYFTVLLKGKNGEAYNIGNAYEISMVELANIVIKASGNPSLKVEFDIDPASVSSASGHGLLSIDKIKALGWNPKIPEDEGFKRTINYYQSGH